MPLPPGLVRRTISDTPRRRQSLPRRQFLVNGYHFSSFPPFFFPAMIRLTRKEDCVSPLFSLLSVTFRFRPFVPERLPLPFSP